MKSFMISISEKRISIVIDTLMKAIKLGFTGKLLLILLFSGLLLVGAMSLVTLWSFQKGFMTYLAEVELRQIKPISDALVARYATEGDWEFIRNNHREWHQFLALSPSAPKRETIRPPRLRPEPPFEKPPRGSRRPPPPPPGPGDATGIAVRLRVLDINHDRIAGPPDHSDRSITEPLLHDGKPIGWLSLTPLPLPEDSLELAFRDRQLITTSLVAGCALVFSFILATLFGRHLLQPIQAITRGARLLAKGEFATRVSVTHHDELGQLASDFNSLAMALEKSENLRRLAMADISHELRTPLSVLYAQIEAMRDGIRPCDKDQLKQLHGNVSSLSRLVDDLYQLTLSDSGALTYRKAPCDLAKLAADAAAAHGELYRDKQLVLQLNAAEPAMISIDANRLRQVLDNLLKNSLRYTDGPGKVVVNVKQHNHLTTIDIEDSAPTVEAVLIEKLCDRFYRVETSRSRATGGGGLGLAICKNVIDAHHGEITIQPSSLGGLWVHIELPHRT